jgi:hypothetical protein
MLIRRSYLDLSPDLKRSSARAVRERLRGALASPGLTKPQQDLIQRELTKLRAWEGGTLHLTPAAPPGVSTDPSDPMVTLEDAKKFGLCDPGMGAWMRSRGVTPTVGAPASFCARDENRRAAALGRRKLHEAKAKARR